MTTRAAGFAQQLSGRVPGWIPFGDRFGGATPPFVLIRAAQKAGLNVIAHPNSTLIELKRTIAQGRPAIVLVRPHGGNIFTRHYRVLVGYREGNPTSYYFNDPGVPIPEQPREEPGNWTIPEPIFLAEWESGGFGPIYRRWHMSVWP